MKKLILLLFSISCFSQIKQPETEFYLNDAKVYWQHIYELKGKKADEIALLFEKEVLSNIKQNNYKFIDNTNR